MGAIDVLVLWLHIVAAAVWVGGIVFLGAVAQPVLKELIPDPVERSKFAGKIGRRFNAVGWTSIVLLVLTGLYNLVRISGGIGNMPQVLFSFNYGRILNAKLALVVGMIVITAHHTFISGPRVRRLILKLESASKQDETAPKLRAEIASLQRENGYLMSVLALLALLTLLLATLLVMPA